MDEKGLHELIVIARLVYSKTCALSNKASQYNHCLICKSMRNINRVLALAPDEHEVANHFDSDIP